MEFTLKTLSPEAVARSLAKAERYRLLNEPGEAQSICLDVLASEPDNQNALATLLLALTEQFVEDAAFVGEAWRIVARLRGDYATAYFSGIVCERRAKAMRQHATLGYGPHVYGWLRDAMSWYEKAEAIRPPGNEDALLRWNACARLIMRDHLLVPMSEERGEPLLLE
jgi:hypothetical protein